MENKHGVFISDQEVENIKRDLLEAQETYRKLTKRQLAEELKVLVSELNLKGIKDKQSVESRFFIVNKKVIQSKSVDQLMKMSTKAQLFDLRQIYKSLKGE